MPSAITFTAQEKADITGHLGISGGSTDAQIQQAMLDLARGSKKVQTGPTPNCPVCNRPLPNNRSPMASSG